MPDERDEAPVDSSSEDSFMRALAHAPPHRLEPSSASAFASKRFIVKRRLGEGGMGVVYEAIDRERDARVALKMMRSLSAEALARFKSEFRALQDLHHPNLVTLGELVLEDEQWFFTMELVDGVDLLAHVRPGNAYRRDNSAPELPGSLDSTQRIPVARTRGGSYHGYDEARLRASVAQLASALHAIHLAGKVHRDVKPSNIRVTGEGRVVLLDFGLVTDLGIDQSVADVHIVGTPDYMAPEQAAAKVVGPPADWYAVGVVLFQALTGSLPFDGAPLQVLLRKQQRDGPSPGEHVSDLPADLEALCTELLRFDPDARPTGAEVLRRLGVQPETSGSHSYTQQAPFVGREDELRMLRESFLARSGGASAVLVSGESGVGKSCLVRRFLDAQSVEHPDIVVLTGRCYERELVPYKGFDGVADSLARYLKRCANDEVAGLLPTRPGPLVQVFPVLRRVKLLANSERSADMSTTDPFELRTRAFTALREMLTRIGDRHPLVIAIDDLQWTDADSVSLLAELLRGPDAPPFLLIATVRPSDSGASSTLTKRLATMRATMRCIELACLSAKHGEELATLLLRRAAPDAKTSPRAIADEADGHPLFIDALVRHATLGNGEVLGSVRLDEALWAQVRRLDETSRALMELLAFAGAPIAQDVLANAAEVEPGAFAKSVSFLRVAHLVRIGAGRGVSTIEPYHDKVRAAVAAKLESATRVACHRKLAVALEASGDADSEALALHWGGAGELERGAHHAEIAGDESVRALAFDHAAALYELALAAYPKTGAIAQGLRVKLGDALANAGRSVRAAAAYRAAAADANRAQGLDLRRRAADQLLRGGHFDDGLVAISEVLASIGISFPRTPLMALFQFLLWRIYLWVRGLGFVRRDESQLSPTDLMRADTCWSVAVALSFVDNIRGAVFASRSLALALSLGEPKRVTRALALQIGFIASPGSRVRRRATVLTARASSLAESVDDAMTTAWVIAENAFLHYLLGDFQASLEPLRRAQHILVTQCRNVAWEIDSVHRLLTTSLFYCGELSEFMELQPKALREAEERGDLYASVNMRVGTAALAWVLRDEPGIAKHRARAAISEWSERGFHVEHWFELALQLHVSLYEDKPLDAEAYLAERSRALNRSILLRIQTVKRELERLRGTIALARAEQRLEPAPGRQAIAIAERCARTLRRQRTNLATVEATFLDVGCAVLGGDVPAAVRGLTRAIPLAEASGLMLYATMARRRLGQLVGGSDGDSMLRAADSWMVERGVRRPDRFTRMFLRGEGIRPPTR